MRLKFTILALGLFGIAPTLSIANAKYTMYVTNNTGIPISMGTNSTHCIIGSSVKWFGDGSGNRVIHPGNQIKTVEWIDDDIDFCSVIPPFGYGQNKNIKFLADAQTNETNENTNYRLLFTWDHNFDDWKWKTAIRFNTNTANDYLTVLEAKCSNDGSSYENSSFCTNTSTRQGGKNEKVWVTVGYPNYWSITANKGRQATMTPEAGLYFEEYGQKKNSLTINESSTTYFYYDYEQDRTATIDFGGHKCRVMFSGSNVSVIEDDCYDLTIKNRNITIISTSDINLPVWSLKTGSDSTTGQKGKITYGWAGKPFLDIERQEYVDEISVEPTSNTNETNFYFPEASDGNGSVAQVEWANYDCTVVFNQSGADLLEARNCGDLTTKGRTITIPAPPPKPTETYNQVIYFTNNYDKPLRIIPLKESCVTQFGYWDYENNYGTVQPGETNLMLVGLEKNLNSCGNAVIDIKAEVPPTALYGDDRFKSHWDIEFEITNLDNGGWSGSKINPTDSPHTPFKISDAYCAWWDRDFDTEYSGGKPEWCLGSFGGQKAEKIWITFDHS